MALLYHLAMSDARVEQFRKMAEQFPDNAMAQFSLGKALLEARRYAEAVGALESAVRLEPAYAAALVSLGDAHAGAGQTAQAREVLTRARDTALAQSHASLAEEIDERLSGLD
ncbi:tetratricopeptide repeat protein [[Archangium] primigenium]|uniref:tetratricopeptide repeat protein n=1 Tax=Melittangium TaxID=44 RepID=UPI001957585B|nr:tetratricopeptide repeat protein [Archangium primigenium]MBM7118825.1 tetratricopeptide repeat protein [Archangium primigenium]